MMKLDRNLFFNVLVALAVPSTLWIGTMVSLSVQPFAGNIDVTAGSEIFRDRCGACHFVEANVTTHHGPNLHEIGRVAGTRKPGVSAAAYLLESILDPNAFVAPNHRQGMPRNIAEDLSVEEIRNIVAFLASRGGKPDYQEIRQLQIPDKPAAVAEKRIIRRDAMELAERAMIDKGKCFQCHSPFRNAEYQWYAPTLFGLGLAEADIRQSIVDPSRVVPEAYRDTVIPRIDGQIVCGQVVGRTQDEVVVLSRDTEQRVTRQAIPWSEIETEDETEDENEERLLEQTNLSRMPSGFGELFSPEELNAIVTLMEQLN